MVPVRPSADPAPLMLSFQELQCHQSDLSLNGHPSQSYPRRCPWTLYPWSALLPVVDLKAGIFPSTPILLFIDALRIGTCLSCSPLNSQQPEKLWHIRKHLLKTWIDRWTSEGGWSPAPGSRESRVLVLLTEDPPTQAFVLATLLFFSCSALLITRLLRKWLRDFKSIHAERRAGNTCQTQGWSVMFVAG